MGLDTSFGLSGAVTPRRGQEANNKRMKRRPWARPHPRAHSIPCQAHFRSKKSANPLRGFSLEASYVHICILNNILFAICLAGGHAPAHSHEGAPSKLRLGGDFSSTSTTPVKRESGRFVRAWEVPSPYFVLAGMIGKLIPSHEMRLPRPKIECYCSNVTT